MSLHIDIVCPHCKTKIDARAEQWARPPADEHPDGIHPADAWTKRNLEAIPPMAIVAP